MQTKMKAELWHMELPIHEPSSFEIVISSFPSVNLAIIIHVDPIATPII